MGPNPPCENDTLCEDWRRRCPKTEDFLRFLRFARDALRGLAWSMSKNWAVFRFLRFGRDALRGLAWSMSKKTEDFLRFLRFARDCIALAYRNVRRALAHAEQVVRKTWAEHLRRTTLAESSQHRSLSVTEGQTLQISALARAHSRAQAHRARNTEAYQSQKEQALQISALAHTLSRTQV